ncbi:YkvA family protein [Saccharothrix hoggarensis]|uniref:YkvA family protein n=1 Tax=Saccharothrix hoggarensis TaxID=913853 RepID=A0ABW3QUG4_9PSEU
MLFFGIVLVVLGLGTLVLRDDAVIGLPPAVVGSALIALGVAAAVLWVVRRRRRWERTGEPRPVGNVVDRAKALPRLLRERKAYGLPTSTMATWGFALVYLVSPIDVLPELLPIIGVTDDAGVAVWLLTSVSTVAGQYLRWERERSAQGTARRPEA